MIQNYRLIWLDNDINNAEYHNFITKLRAVINTIDLFNDLDACIEFISDTRKDTLFLLVSNTLGKKIIPVIHNQVQVTVILLFSEGKISDESWIQQWFKIHGIFTDITSACEALKYATDDYNQNTIPMTFFPTTTIVDHNFMYTLLLKEIIYGMDFQHSHIRELLRYCREQFVNNSVQLKNIDRFQTDYRRQQPICWYTDNCIFYSILNDALRTLNVDVIFKMGFFIRDLHKQIVTLHAEQYGSHQPSSSLTVYRGQGMSHADFNLLMRTKDGALSMNNFLYANKDRTESFDFARRTMARYDLVGVLFIITIDFSISTITFANVCIQQTKQQILFSMHTCFHIHRMKQINGNNRLWQVELTLIDGNYLQSHPFIERVREETKGSIEWLRIGKLMIKLAQYDKAEDLYRKILIQTTDKREQGDLFYQLGCTNYYQGKYTEALSCYEKSLMIHQKTSSLEHPDVARCYNDMAIIYGNIGENSKAFSYFEKAIDIFEKNPHENDLDLANSYNSIGMFYSKTSDFTKAFSFYEKALEIYQKILPSNDSHLANSYTNIGSVYVRMNDYIKALPYYEKSLVIQQEILPSNHPDLAGIYGHVGMVSFFTGNHSKGISYCQRALTIAEQSLSDNHPHIQVYRTNLEYVKSHLKDTHL